MTPEKIAEAMEVMAEAQREDPPEGERQCSCDVLVGRVVYGGAVRVEWREGPCHA